MCRVCFVIAIILMFSGCSSIPTPTERFTDAKKLAESQGWELNSIPTEKFVLTSLLSNKIRKAKKVTIYIEGDGLAWRTRNRPSRDPSPINPIALKLALKHTDGNVAYLARPCQFRRNRETYCEQTVWTSARFSRAVINSMSQAVTVIKEKYSADDVVLVGYSGGGAVAVLLAAMREDITEIITVAGNLDHRQWTENKNISPLTESLNPADYAYKLSHIKQTHFIGRDDQVIPKALSESFLQKLPEENRANIIEINNYSHSCCWEKNWLQLYNSR